MKPRTIFVILFALAGAALLFFSVKNESSPADYVQQIERVRKRRDDFMREDASSPFKRVAQQYQGLNYFAPDPTYRVKASLIPIEDKKIIKLGTSDNSDNDYLEFGWAEFELKGVKNKLLILENTEEGPSRGTLFLSFVDATSANETYGAGRYLEIEKIPAMTTVVLDFNLAYNPYCAYSDEFSCPLPPKENILTIPINAGEKVWH